MTKESMAAMPEIMAMSRMKGVQPQQQQPSPALPPAGSPPPAGVQGFNAPPPAPLPQGMQAPMSTVPEKKKPIDKGEFPIKIIGSIQMIYATEQAKQDRLQGNLAQGMALKPGWGGQ